MELRTSVICGVIGSVILLLSQVFYLIRYLIWQYADDGYKIVNSIPASVDTVIGVLSLIAWLLIVCFLLGLLKKTK